jgi:hypothetical protein
MDSLIAQHTGADEASKRRSRRVVVEEAQDDFWVGKAITDARIAYETWTALLRGEMKTEAEFAPNSVSGPYVNLFTNYAKGQFLSAVAVRHRGFFDYKLDSKTDTARRIQGVVSEAQIDEFLRLGATLSGLP